MRRELIELECDEFDMEFPLLAVQAGKDTLSTNWNVWGVCTGIVGYESLLNPVRENSPKITVVGLEKIPLTPTIRLHDRVGYQVFLTDSKGEDDDIVGYLKREYSDYLTKGNVDNVKYEYIKDFIELTAAIAEDDTKHVYRICNTCVEYSITDFASLEKYRASFLHGVVKELKTVREDYCRATVRELEQLQKELNEDNK